MMTCLAKAFVYLANRADLIL